MVTLTTRIQHSIVMRSIPWPIIAQMMSMQTHYQMAHIGTIGMAICKAMMTCTRLATRFHALSTTTVRFTAGEETTTGNSVWATPAGEKRFLSTLTSALVAPLLRWVSMIQEPKGGRPTPMHAQFSTTASWCAGVPTETGNSALGTPQRTVFGNR